MNPNSFGQGSAAYWGADQGLGYVSADQKDWPYRNHAYGIDVFNRFEFESNHYAEYLTDSLSGATLANNANEASRDGYRNHHIVSFGAWDTSDFGGGVIPTSVGCWAVHNCAGYIWGHYGEYRCTGNEGGERPPDGHCCPEGISTEVSITCFSVTPEANGEDYLLRYCLYVFVNMHAIATDRDDYAGIAWTSTPAAALGCKVELKGFDTLGIQFAKNLYRCM